MSLFEESDLAQRQMSFLPLPSWVETTLLSSGTAQGPWASMQGSWQGRSY